MLTANSIDKERVITKLDTLQFVVETNIELLQNDPLLKEQLNWRMQIVQSYLNELDHWEKSGDQMQYDNALSSAIFALERVQELISSMLGQ